jgi:hypothetical protein
MIEEPTLTDSSTPGDNPGDNSDDRWLRKIDVNYCQGCSRIIELVTGVGWLHVYRPVRQNGPYGATPKCRAIGPAAQQCGTCRAVIQTTEAGKPEIHANRETGLPCLGSKDLALPPMPETTAFTGLNE